MPSKRKNFKFLLFQKMFKDQKHFRRPGFKQPILGFQIINLNFFSNSSEKRDLTVLQVFELYQPQKIL